MYFVGSTFETTQISGNSTSLCSAAGLFYCPLRNPKQFIRSQRLQGSLKGTAEIRYLQTTSQSDYWATQTVCLLTKQKNVLKQAIE